MPPRFHPEELRLELSVADLLESAQLRAIGFANRGGYERMWVGQALHSRYQEEALGADPTYRRELVLRGTLPHRGWEVTLHGRADGVRREPDGTLVVEEIKSVRRGARPRPAVREVWERQATLYAWLLHHQESVAVRAELVLVEIGGGEVERAALAVDLPALEIEVRRRLNSLLAGFEGERLRAAGRHQVAEALAFPHSSPRPGQERILEAVEGALERREHLLLEAPTGLGKTVAALLPALRHVLAHDRRLFVLTAKTLQQEMAMRVLALLNHDDRFHSLRLRAKTKMCANGEVLCHEEYCPFARDYALKVHQTRLLEQLEAGAGTLLPDAIYDAARTVEACPFEVSLELAGRAQAVVCDYNYAFEPYVSLSDFGPQADLRDVVLVVDEIHNLVDRGRGYYSPELSSRAARRAAEELGRDGRPVPAQVASLCRELAALIETTVAGGLDETPGAPPACETRLPEDVLWELRPEFDGAFADYVEHQRDSRSFQPDDPFVDLYFRFVRFVDTLLLASDGAFSHCLARDGNDDRLRILCKDASRLLGRTLNRCHSVIGLSATLSPFEFYRDLLGFDAGRSTGLSLPSPFPPDHRRVVIDATVGTTYRQRPDNYPRIARRLSEFADAVPGNCLALFPSYEFLARVADLLEVRSKRVLVQTRADSDREREAILETLRAAFLGDVLLLAVAGGVFAEGVDYPGTMLLAVAVVGPCLPAVTLDQELLRGYYEERFARGFEYAFVVPGMTRVVQAAGRLIRSPDDTGVIALFDRRFLTEPYRRYLPADWLADDEPERLAGEPAAVATEFFRR